MSELVSKDQPWGALLADFFASYDINKIRIFRDTDIRDAEASLVEVSFGRGDETGPYQVNFKLLSQASRIHRHLLSIGPRPDLRLELSPQGEDQGHDMLDSLVREFLQAIRDRVAKVHKEQSILGIQPVGKSFLLYGKTRFDVLSDNGKGQLAIRIQREDGNSEAGMAANDLLDGLYAGVITRD